MPEIPEKKQKMLKKQNKLRKYILLGSVIFILIGGFLSSYNLRVWVAGTLLTTQHRHWAKYTLIGEQKLDELKEEIDRPKIANSEPVPEKVDLITTPIVHEVEEEVPEPVVEKPKPAFKVTVDKIKKDFSGTHYFKGHIMTINDPNRVHLVPAEIKKGRNGKPRGEWINEFSERLDAIAGLNASGFSDPGGKSWATEPMGLIIHDGVLVQNYDPSKSATALGITYEGKLVTGSYSAQELLDMGIRDAMSFKPQLVVDGENLFPKDTAAWGLQPRSAVGQRLDGTIIFIQIDGRSSESIGASMKDMADLMIEHGAINAMAMDGGTSAFMIHHGEILTDSPVSDERGRFLPNAWMVY